MREKSDFLKDVEIAVQGLERQKRENPQEEGEKVYRKFKESDKEAVRLAAALRGFFLREGVSETQREALYQRADPGCIGRTDRGGGRRKDRIPGRVGMV